MMIPYYTQPPGEMHDTGQEEVETVDWLGLNQRLGVSKDQLAACIPNMSQSQHPAVPTVAGRGQQAPRGSVPWVDGLVSFLF